VEGERPGRAPSSNLFLDSPLIKNALNKVTASVYTFIRLYTQALSRTFKNFFVVIVSKKISVLDFLDYNVVESTGGVYSGASWHGARSGHVHVRKKVQIARTFPSGSFASP